MYGLLETRMLVLYNPRFFYKKKTACEKGIVFIDDDDDEGGAGDVVAVLVDADAHDGHAGHL